MLTAYFDESGSVSEHPYIVVAGLVGSVSQWTDFNARWRAVRNDYNAPSFHGKDFPYKEPYCRWGKAKQDAYLKELVDVVLLLPRSTGMGLTQSGFDFANEVFYLREEQGALGVYARWLLL